MSISVQSLTDPGTEEKTADVRKNTVDSDAFPEAMEQAVQEVPDSKSVRTAAKQRVITSTETTQPSDSSAASTAVYETILGSMRTHQISSTDNDQFVESASLSETEGSPDGTVEKTRAALSASDSGGSAITEEKAEQTGTASSVDGAAASAENTVSSADDTVSTESGSDPSATPGETGKTVTTSGATASSESTSAATAAGGVTADMTGMETAPAEAVSAEKSDHSDSGLDSIFVEAGKTYNVSPILLKAIAEQESGLRNGLTSSAGAQGIMQLMPDTARGLGVTDSMDVYQNIMGGAKLISSHLGKYDGNLDLALAAYNAGSGNVDKYGGVPPFKETQDYIVNVKKNLETVTIDAGAGQGSAETSVLNTKAVLSEKSGDTGSSTDALAEAVQNLGPSDLAKMLQLQMMLASSGLQNPDDYSGF